MQTMKYKGKFSDIERWKRIKKYPNFFISSKGRLWNTSSHNIWCENLDKDGYYRKTFGSGKDQENIRIHKLVATHFIPNPLNLETIDHIDGNKTNNDITNLQWMSRGDNVRKSFLGDFGVNRSKPMHKKIMCLETGIIYDSACQAQKDTGAYANSILLCCKYIYKATYLPNGNKLHWRYVTESEM